MAKSKRPIDKWALNYIDTAVGTSASNTTLYTATVAETLTGMIVHWNATRSASASNLWMGIVIVRDGSSLSTPSVTSGQIPYEPEQDVLWSKFLSQNTGIEPFYGTDIVKSMRKLKTNDTTRS